MKSFKSFLMTEDLGIGPEGTTKNPSIQNYSDTLKRERNVLRQEYNRSRGNPGEMSRIKNLMKEKERELQNTRLLSNPLTADKAKPTTGPGASTLTTYPGGVEKTVPGTPAPSALSSTPEPLSQESAFEKLMYGSGDNNTTITPASGFNMQRSSSMSSNIASPTLSSDTMGKYSKSFKL